MATASTTSAKTRQRKNSFTSTISLLNRTRSMTDQTLLGVLNILRMDEGQGQSFMVKAILPDGKPRLVSRQEIVHCTNIIMLLKRILECCILFVKLWCTLYLCVFVFLFFPSYRTFCVSRNFVPSNWAVGFAIAIYCTVVGWTWWGHVDFKTSVIDSAKFLAFITVVCRGKYAFHALELNGFIKPAV